MPEPLRDLPDRFEAAELLLKLKSLLALVHYTIIVIPHPERDFLEALPDFDLDRDRDVFRDSTDLLLKY